MVFLSLGSGGNWGDIVAVQEVDTFAPKRLAHGFEMHQMGAAADLDIAFAGRLSEGVEQPARVVIRHQPVPFAADNRNRRTDLRRIVGELAVPGLDDLAERTERRLDPKRIAGTASMNRFHWSSEVTMRHAANTGGVS